MDSDISNLGETDPTERAIESDGLQQSTVFQDAEHTSNTDIGGNGLSSASVTAPDLDVPSISAETPTKTSESPTVPISDNPLDAPEAPRPEDEDGDKEDEEMGGIGDESQKGLGSPDKEAIDSNSPQKPSAGINVDANADANEDQPTQTKAALESYSAWFDMNKINNLEKKALPEFFNNRNRSKTPEVYKDYRDFMVNTYRLNPTEYLTVTACRRNLAGDVCAIMRVHAFLEQWGLINYQIDPETRPSASGPPFTGHFRIKADTPRGLQPFQPAPGSKMTEGKSLVNGTDNLLRAYREASPRSKADLNLEIRRNFYDQNGKDLTPAAKEKQSNGEESTPNGVTSAESAIESLAKDSKKAVNCYSCGVDCTRLRYHYARSTPASTGSAAVKLKYDLCGKCFREARQPQAHVATDFVKLEDPDYTTVPDRDKPWTDSELLRLLEALELFDENWDSIADHVGSRTREECVVKFLQLEIEDKYLESNPDDPPSYGALDHGRVPFTQAENPVMTVVGFLAGMTEPSVAAAAAGRSVKVMANAMKRRIANGIGGEGEESNEKNEDTKMEDQMDVDQTESLEAAPAPAAAADDNQVTLRQNDELQVPSLPTIALATSAARAGALASNEEREMTRLVSSAVNISLQKLELKLQQFSEMETVLQSERRELERGRQQLFLDRLAFRKRLTEAEDALRVASLRGGDEGASIIRDIGYGGETLTFHQSGKDQAKENLRPLTSETGNYRSLEL
ncbi:MAG: hypothetical protein LQ342_003907 [Letrouitia transgressa]|nr:MAG: hypothetical protein LQ342_003907 [Letrouitia transgressa]